MDEVVVTDRSNQQAGKYWVIRAGHDSMYFSHFRQNKLIAIGHTEDSKFTNVTEGELSPPEILQVLSQYQTRLGYTKVSKSTRSMQYGQVSRFLNNVAIGDTILTISAKTIVVGKVTSNAKLSYTPLTIAADSATDKVPDQCEYTLQRDVDWGRARSKISLPYIVEKSFRNTSTIFELKAEEQIKALNHWMYPIHYFNDEIRCSLDLKTKDNVGNRDLTLISRRLDQMEAASQYIAKLIEENHGNDLSTIDPEKLIKYLLNYSNYNLTTQHAFMSPGHQFIQLSGSEIQKIAFAMLFSIQFSCSISFSEASENSKIETVKEVSTLVAKVLEENETESITDSIRKLKIAVPTQIGRSISPKYSMEDTEKVTFETPTPSDKKIL
jgi:predicted Mrr-cat superfamily restriction endonuclease